jgi:hypothetical protein
MADGLVAGLGSDQWLLWDLGAKLESLLRIIGEKRALRFLPMILILRPSQSVRLKKTTKSSNNLSGIVHGSSSSANPPRGSARVVSAPCGGPLLMGLIKNVQHSELTLEWLNYGNVRGRRRTC